MYWYVSNGQMCKYWYVLITIGLYGQNGMYCIYWYVLVCICMYFSKLACAVHIGMYGIY